MNLDKCPVCGKYVSAECQGNGFYCHPDEYSYAELYCSETCAKKANPEQFEEIAP